jgi:hypothetical protein
MAAGGDGGVGGGGDSSFDSVVLFPIYVFMLYGSASSGIICTLP